MWRHVASNFLTFLVVLGFVLAGVIMWGQSRYRAEGPLEASICLRVERGSTMRAVSRELQQRGAIGSGVLFRIGADYGGKEDALKAGSWLIPEGASMAEMIDIVTRGGASTCGTEVVYRIGVNRVRVDVRALDPATEAYVAVAEFDLPGEAAPPAAYVRKKAEPDTRFRVNVAEGVTSWQVATALGAIDVLSGEIAEIPPEGSLAPFDYEVGAGDSRIALIARMTEVQKLRLAAAWEARAPDLPIDSPAELLILASLVEKETGVPQERGRVASVFVNRLKRGMRLQTDPTVIYGITGGREALGRGLRQSELRRATPYNTYVIEGLPSTPIANPGEASLMAAANPDDTDYLFFVADGTGGHAFAGTLAEHNENVARWRRIEAEQGSQ